jgi:hypothetical protein
MERRHQIRFECNRPARVFLLKETQPARIVRGHVLNVSGRGMQLATSEPMPVGLPVRVEWDDLLVLGEICYSRISSGGEYSAGLRLEQALTNLDELTHLWRTLGEEEAPVAPLPCAGR